MVEIDPITGLPKELGVWDDIVKENQQVTVYIDRRKFGKEYTVVEFADSKQINVKELGKKLKTKLACGGTSKDGQIALQGKHVQATVDLLVDEGFAPETIEVKKSSKPKKDSKK